jgi:hypothetical protein
VVVAAIAILVSGIMRGWWSTDMSSRSEPLSEAMPLICVAKDARSP